MSRILVVEDDPLNLRVLLRFLQSRGHQAAGVSSAEAAILRVGKEPFDAILLDNVLPGMTGFQALTELSARTKAPIVVMTGHADEELRKDATLLGAKGFLYKPFDYDLLSRLLEELVVPGP